MLLVTIPQISKDQENWELRIWLKKSRLWRWSPKKDLLDLYLVKGNALDFIMREVLQNYCVMTCSRW